MATSPRSNLKRATFGLLTAGLLSSAVAIGTTTAVSQSAGCSGDHIATFDGQVLASFADAGLGFEVSRTYPVSIPAGQYDLNGHGGDTYVGRAATVPQTSERWFAQILDGAGNVLATSGTTADLADGIESATWAGGLGLVNLASDATHVRVVHAHQTTAETNSVYPSCVGFATYVEPTPPTTTTVEPTPTTVAPTPEPVVVATPLAAVVAGQTETARPSFTG